MDTVFDKFGGVRSMAGHLQEPPSTVQSWKTAGRIPAARQPDVLRVAAKLNLCVTPLDVIFPMGDAENELVGADHVTCDTRLEARDHA